MNAISAQLIPLLPRLRRYALSLCRAADIADDLVQAACEKALAHPRQSFDVSFDAWMFRILRNSWIDRLRRLKTRGVEVDVAARDDLALIDRSAPPETRLMLEQTLEAIGRLPQEQRELLLIVCVEEMSYREAAAILDLPIGTVMSRLARARRTLAKDVGFEPGLMP